jgi:hypothetical protein
LVSAESALGGELLDIAEGLCANGHSVVEIARALLSASA